MFFYSISGFRSYFQGWLQKRILGDGEMEVADATFRGKINENGHEAASFENFD